MLAPNDNSEADVTFTTSNAGIDVAIQANGKSSFPGVKITPATPWDAGAFGHPRLQEFIFGGTTRTFLQASAGPSLFLSH